MRIKYHHQHQYELIRANLRLLGCLTITLKNINSDIIDFVSLYQHRYYDSIQEINCVEGYNEERSICNAPSTAYSMESLLKKVGNIYISDY